MKASYKLPILLETEFDRDDDDEDDDEHSAKRKISLHFVNVGGQLQRERDQLLETIQLPQQIFNREEIEDEKNEIVMKENYDDYHHSVDRKDHDDVKFDDIDIDCTTNNNSSTDSTSNECEPKKKKRPKSKNRSKNRRKSRSRGSDALSKALDTRRISDFK